MSEEQTELLKITDKVADLVHRLAGPIAEELGLMLGDKARVYRVKNWVKTVEKTERILRDAGLPPGAVPPRLLLPIIESSSLEDNDSLQELWAGLLATASQQSNTVTPSFVETLKQLSPDEAKHLEHVYEAVGKLQRQKPTKFTPITLYAFTDRWGAPHGVSSDIYERLGIIRRDFDVQLQTRGSFNREPSSLEDVLSKVNAEMRSQFLFTDYGIAFLDACHGPGPVPTAE